MDYALRADQLSGTSRLRLALLSLPLFFFIIAAWMVRPLSVGNIALAYAAPLLFGTGLLLLRVRRAELAAMLHGVRIELALTLLMAVLALLSVINSSEPFRILRILFPCILPTLLFVQLVALKQISPATVASVPRRFLIAGLVFGCLPLLLSLISDGLQDFLYRGYRYIGMFENGNQIGVMVAVLVPLAIVEAAIADNRWKRLFWLAALIVLIYALVQIGAKTTLFITLGYAWFFYLLVHARFHSPTQNVFRFAAVLGMMIFLIIFGLQIANAINPVLAAKIEALFTGGLENYATIESRQLLWQEAFAQGSRHWLIGTGAGERILGTEHAHNLILDYFRGIGLFGAFAIALLCLRILWRAVAKTIPLLLGRPADSEYMRILACYVAAAVYVVCNQLSNSFGPGTIAALWIIYLPAVLSDPQLSRSGVFLSGTASQNMGELRR